MDLPDDVYTVFTAQIEPERPPSLRVPEQELRVGNLEEGGTYRVAILPPVTQQDSETATASQARARPRTDPPVDVGETLEVEIEDLGDKGDGIARIGPGYVIFVPGTDVGDRVEIEVTEARENFAFGELLDGEPVSE